MSTELHAGLATGRTRAEGAVELGPDRIDCEVTTEGLRASKLTKRKRRLKFFFVLCGAIGPTGFFFKMFFS